MRSLFLSHVLNSSTPLYKNQGETSFNFISDFEFGNHHRKMKWVLDNHAGTHIDAPGHYIESGKSIDDFNGDFWLFNNIGLVSLKDEKDLAISLASLDFENNDFDKDLILIKTGYEKHRGSSLYQKNYPYFLPELAEQLKNKFPKLRVVGIDCISIKNPEFNDIGDLAHQEFLKREILLIEDMHLSEIKSSPDMVVILPLRISGADASPVSILGLYE